MSNLDDALAEVWTATSVDQPGAAFRAGVLERIAKRRMRADAGVAFAIALALTAIAWAAAPLSSVFAAALSQAVAAEPVMTAAGVIAVGLAVLVWRRRPALT